MASVSPIEATDLNGCAINPSDIISDDLIGYCSYVKNLCTELGTKNDTEEGYQSFLDFQKEIQAAKISTFEPDDIQTDDNFQKIDLTGESAEVAVLPMSMYMGVNMQMLMGEGVTRRIKTHRVSPANRREERKERPFCGGGARKNSHTVAPTSESVVRTPSCVAIIPC